MDTCPDCQVSLVDSPPAKAPDDFELVCLFDGSTVFCDMLSEALRQHRIASIYRGQEPLLGVMGDMVRPPYGSLWIGNLDLRERREEIEDALSLVGASLPADR